MKPWLAIVGIGEDGLAGVPRAGQALIDTAEVLIGGRRHLAMLPADNRERLEWPSPLGAMLDRIEAMRGRRVCVLATGDPMHFGIGATLAARIPAEEMTIVPAASAFALAAARLAWPLEEVATISLHARPLETLRLHVQPGARLLILAHDRTTPDAVAAWLTERGFGASRLVALGHMGGEREARFDGLACEWQAAVPNFHTLAVECVAGPGADWLPRTPGLPDEAFVHDGKLTKREVRAASLARLMPLPGGVLWDVGAGCGSVAIEWLRAEPKSRAIAIEPRADRRDMVARNAAALGVPGLEIVAGAAPDALAALPSPDAIFIGGGLSEPTLAAATGALKPGGRLVAHAVTLESEAILLSAYARLGGELARIAVAHAAPLGGFAGWRPAMPVTQWAWTKR